MIEAVQGKGAYQVVIRALDRRLDAVCAAVGTRAEMSACPPVDRPGHPHVHRPIRSFGSKSCPRASVRQPAGCFSARLGEFVSPEHLANTHGIGPKCLGNDVKLRALQLKNPRSDSSVEVELNTLDQDRVHINPRNGVLHRCHRTPFLASSGLGVAVPSVAVVPPYGNMRRLHGGGRSCNRFVPHNILTTETIIVEWNPPGYGELTQYVGAGALL
ncbi:hypothetical protein SAMN04488075_2854 [Paracoccus alkenifer]|uniref:Uncharacterized protein n=1 Tax=Paracoccus alkenifer TaxID=65735 RepID=A0A1H6NI50_9RHOB|nr:hypothetical protein SAMN04488075_2854 [Paracoccus alkenifer]